MNRISFLETVARTLYGLYEERIDSCCFIFPNRRAALYFQQALTTLIKRELWMPDTMGIIQFVEKYTIQKASDPYLLLPELFKIFRNLTGREEKLEQFLYLGHVLLHDFDQVDKYLINPKVLFTNVRDLQQMGQDFHFLSEEQKRALASFWASFFKHPDHALNKHFISLWEILPNLYSLFREVLESKGLAYEGMLYRKMAEELEDNTTNSYIASYDKFVFIGFNALNPCEKKLFHFLKKENKALFFWDYDPFYTENPMHEAGLFLRENIRHFPSLLQPDKDFALSDKTGSIQIVPVASRVMQTKVIPQLLEKHKILYDTKTAIILSDENLLIPLLYGLGNRLEEGNTVNVTMGYPLSHTSLYSLMQSLLQYFFHSEEKDLAPVSLHPYAEPLNLAPLFNNVPKTAADLHELLIEITNRAATSSLLPPEDVLLKTIAAETRKQINKLYLSVSSSGLDISAAVFAGFVKQQLSRTFIPFSGEPLEGLQVMGMLETRCLDFDNLILVSAQDHLLPKSYKETSTIPYNLRKAFGLPTQEQHTAVWAYYFYRLLHHANNIFVIYDNNPESPSGGEISRFIRQISLELPKMSITSAPLVLRYSLPETNAITIPKTHKIQNALHAFLSKTSGKTLSPTALLSYIRCPLQFCYAYVLSLKEPVFAADWPDTLQIGNETHRILERLYRPAVGRILEKKQVLHLLSNLEKPGGTTRKIPGSQLLYEEIAAFYAKRFITADANSAPFKVLSLEKKFSLDHKEIPMTGIVDRIDIRQNNYILIDYKTGEKKNAFLRVEDLFSSWHSQNNGDAFQMLCYSYLIKDLFKNGELPVPMVFYLNVPVIDTSGSYISYNRQALDTPTALAALQNEFIYFLDILLKELFNFNVPFHQTDEIKNCNLCPYISICQREKIND